MNTDCAKLTTYNRLLVARIADYPGRIPFLGTPVGIIRIVTSVTTVLFCILGASFCLGLNQLYKSIELKNTHQLDEKASSFLFFAQQIINEAERGFSELAPGLIIYFDRLQNLMEKQGLIQGEAFGNYFYQSDQGLLLYSDKLPQ